MKRTREEYIALMTFQDSVEPFFSELFGLLPGLAGEWREQGAGEMKSLWMRSALTGCHSGCIVGLFFGFLPDLQFILDEDVNCC